MSYSALDQEFKGVLYLKPGNKTKKIIIGLLVSLGVFGLLLYFSQFETKKSTSYVHGNKMEGQIVKENSQESPVPLLKERVNILLIGIAGLPWPAPYLTDSIQIVSIDEKVQKIIVIAIPRDLLVKIPGSNYKTRINSLYSLENNPDILCQKIKEITNLTIQYYIVLDLTTLEKIIDILGGIDVKVKEAIYDPKFPTLWRGYETFSISPGNHHLSGKIAIKYIRSRHQKRGDFGRIERQQEVMEALRKKMIKLNNPENLPKIITIFKKFEGKTNISLKELKSMVSIARKVSNQKIEYFVFDADSPDSLLYSGKTILGKNLAFVLWPKKGRFNYTQIREKINSLFN